MQNDSTLMILERTIELVEIGILPSTALIALRDCLAEAPDHE